MTQSKDVPNSNHWMTNTLMSGWHERGEVNQAFITQLEQDVVEVWLLRLAGKVQESMERLASVLQSLRCYSDLSVVDFLSSYKYKEELPCRIDLLALHVSLVFRFEGVARAKELLQEIQDQMQVMRLRPTYYFHFQMGLISLTEERYWDALKQFTHANDLAKNDVEKACAVTNMILAMEGQDLSWKTRLDAFKEDLKSYSPLANALVARQIRALEDRTAFRASDFSYADEKDTFIGLDQKKFFALYTKQLRELYAQQVEKNIPTCRDYLYEFQGSYRAQTLTNHVNLNASHFEVKSREVISRLYLWVWRWLVRPDHAQIQRILHTIKELSDCGPLPMLMASDSMMLVNALDWILLFSGQKNRSYVTTIKLLPTEFSGSSLQLERCLIDMIMAMRDGDNVLAQDRVIIAEHLLSQLPKDISKKLGIVSLVKSTISLIKQEKVDVRTVLEKSIASVINRKTALAKNKLNVDLNTTRVSWHGGAPIYSRIAAITLFLLKDNGTLSIFDLMEFTYGYKYFDASVQNTKINNIVYQINKILPQEARLKRKRQEVVFEKYKSINVSSPSPHCFTAMCSLDRLNPLLGDITSPKLKTSVAKVTSEDIKTSKQAWYTRKDLEVLLGVSRSTVIRAIRVWRAKKMVEVRGVGKASRYKFEPEFEDSILAGKDIGDLFL